MSLKLHSFYRTLTLCAALIFLAIRPSQADVEIQFPKASYTIRELIQRVEHETPYDISLPFADEANRKKTLPAQLKLKDVLHWISRYYERHNGILLNFTIKGSKVHFVKALGEQKDRVTKLMSSKLHLRGKSWTIHLACQSAAEQIGQPIHLPFSDKASILMDYDHHCSLEDWLEEVREYWKRHNQRYLRYEFTVDGIRFIDAGSIESSDLRIELLGAIRSNATVARPEKTLHRPKAIEQLEDLDPVSPKREQRDSSLPSEKKLSPPPKILKLMPIKAQVAPLTNLPEPPRRQTIEPSAEEQIKELERVLLAHPGRFTQSSKRGALITALLKPHQQPSDVSSLLWIIEPFCHEGRGWKAWKANALALDLSKCEAWQKKRVLRKVEETWITSLLQASSQKVKQGDRGWHGLWTSSIGVGRNAIAMGESSGKFFEKEGGWLGNSVEMQYRHNPVGSWKMVYGLTIDSLWSASPKELSLLGITASWQGTKATQLQGLRALSPYFHMQHYDDALFGALKQSMFLSGFSAHWNEMKHRGLFISSRGSTDLFIEKLSPRNAHRIYTSENKDLSQVSLGLRHRHSWTGARENLSFGPIFEGAFYHRNADSNKAKGLELAMAGGWTVATPLWQTDLIIENSRWFREESVQQFKLALTWRRLFESGTLGTELELERSSSDDIIMDYSRSSIEVSWELRW